MKKDAFNPSASPPMRGGLGILAKVKPRSPTQLLAELVVDATEGGLTNSKRQERKKVRESILSEIRSRDPKGEVLS